jgi:hypothetical protein
MAAATALAPPPAAAGAAPSFSQLVRSVLNKGPTDARLEDVVAVEQQIGKGAFGIVRAARSRATAEPLAVKSISKAKLVCPEDVKDVQVCVCCWCCCCCCGEMGHSFWVGLKQPPYKESFECTHKGQRKRAGVDGGASQTTTK